jgi:membrane protease YdiL (CAAX protease family)
LRGGIREIGLGLAATVPMLVFLIVALRSRWGPLARIRQFFDEVVRPTFLGCSTFDLAMISLAAGVGEELLFRGLIQAMLADRLGVGWGLFVASLIFGLIHAITPTYAILAGLIGAYLGGVWLIGGSLLVPAIAHGLYDFIALRVMLQGRADSRVDSEP